MENQREYMIRVLCSLRQTTSLNKHCIETKPVAYARGQLHAFRLAWRFIYDGQLDHKYQTIITRLNQADDSSFYELATDLACNLMAGYSPDGDDEWAEE